jgi:hypothetical protein
MEKFEKTRQDIKTEYSKQMIESEENPLADIGITKYKLGTDYFAAGPNVFKVNDLDVGNDIETTLKSKNIQYTRSALNFVINK